MGNKKVMEGGRITGLGIVLVTSMILIFLLLSFSKDMALIYMLMLMTYYFWYTHDKDITLPVEKTRKGRIVSMFFAGVIAFTFLLIASFTGRIPIDSVIQVLAAATPVFAGNQLFTFIAWGILIPIIETVLFFGIFFEGLATFLGKFMRIGPISTKFNLLSPALWGIILVIAGIFTAYHFQTRGLTDNLGLMITFIFAVFSCWTVSYFRQTREAILLHIYSNSLAVLSAMGIGLILFGG